jgi:TolA-binding protein
VSDQSEESTETVHIEGDLLVAREPWREKILPWLVAVLAVLVAMSLWRSFVVEDAVEHVDEAAAEVRDVSTEGRQAAIEARDELRDAVRAIEEANEGEPELQNQAIIAALEAIARIEVYLCGGPCEQGET